MKGYVINLKKRPDRLERFTHTITHLLKDYVDMQIIEAVDGSCIEDLNTPYLRSFVEYCFLYRKNHNERRVRGIIGATLSHLKCYKDFVENTKDDYAIIFEDDCDVLENTSTILSFFKNLNLPSSFGLIFLNTAYDDRDQTCYSPSTNTNLIEFNNYSHGIWYTAESYIIHRDFAKILIEYIELKMDIIDHIHKRCILKYLKKYNTYKSNPMLFKQYDRSDTNIQYTS